MITTPKPETDGAIVPFRPLRQTIMHNPPETYGDCQRTCLAMVLGLEVTDVPHFADENNYSPDASRRAETNWLRERSCGYIQIPIYGEWGLDYIRGLVENIPVIVSGRSPRGEWNHDIVLLNGEIHDPHPDNTGLAGPCIDKDKPDEPQWYWVRFVVPAVNSHDTLQSENARLREQVKELREGLAAMVNAKALKAVRELVAGWNGEGKADGPYERHPSKVGAILPTNCGAIYELDEAMCRARDLMEKTNG